METAPMRDVTDAKRADDQVPPAAPSGFDRRTLIRRGAALSAGLAATGTLVRLGLA